MTFISWKMILKRVLYSGLQLDIRIQLCLTGFLMVQDTRCMVFIVQRGPYSDLRAKTSYLGTFPYCKVIS